jgi:Protein of unknown function (DUF998)
MTADRHLSTGAPRGWAIAGAIGPVAYLIAVLVGGLLWSGYSQYAETVSTLTSTGAPHQEVVLPLFAAYNVSLVAFAVGVDRGIRPVRWGRLGPAFLGAAGVGGLGLFLFPQGPPNDPLSGTGVPHTILAGAIALAFLLALGFLWRRLRQDPGGSGEARFTAGMLVAGIVLGAFGALSISAPYAGLAERMSIGTFLLWTEVIAIRLIRRPSTRAARAEGEEAGSPPAPAGG